MAERPSRVLAPRLTPDTVVGVVAPSSPAPEEMLGCTVDYWTERGHRVVMGDHVRGSLGGYLAGSARERAADLNRMLADPEVGLVVPAMGGKGASHLLPLIDYDAARTSPTLILGLSDASVLLMAITARTGLVTFHGPTGMHFGTLPEYSERWMWRMLASAEGPLVLEPLEEWRTLRGSGVVRGPLLGGHLRTITAVVGTPYAPDWDGAILFVEEIDAELHDVDAALTHLRLAGVLDRIAGMIVGVPVNVAERYWASDEGLADVVLRCCDGLPFPVLDGVHLGHTDDRLTLPVGAIATLDATRASLTVDGPVVS